MEKKQVILIYILLLQSIVIEQMEKQTGILNIDEGDILIDGKSIKKEPLEAKKNFGFVPDSPDTFLKLKGIEYLMFMADVR